MITAGRLDTAAEPAAAAVTEARAIIPPPHHLIPARCCARAKNQCNHRRLQRQFQPSRHCRSQLSVPVPAPVAATHASRQQLWRQDQRLRQRHRSARSALSVGSSPIPTCHRRRICTHQKTTHEVSAESAVCQMNPILCSPLSHPMTHQKSHIPFLYAGYLFISLQPHIGYYNDWRRHFD